MGKRNIFGLLEQDAEFARRGIRLRQFGQRIIELVGGKRIHPSWGAPGGVLRTMGEAERDEIRGWIPEGLELVEIAIGRLKGVLDWMAEEMST